MQQVLRHKGMSTSEINASNKSTTDRRNQSAKHCPEDGIAGTGWLKNLH
jgi:hypothetical protein